MPELYQQMKRRAEELAKEPGTFYTDQFHNADAIRAYMGIGTELVEQAGTGLAAFCGGVGTAGMIAGVSRALKEAGCKARIVALEPATSPVLTTGKGGPHRVDGIAAGFRPPHLKDGEFDEVRTVEEPAAREMARRLAKEEGIFAGTSSGLNVTAALQLAQELGRGKHRRDGGRGYWFQIPRWRSVPNVGAAEERVERDSLRRPTHSPERTR